jgi:hypothetical protein
VTSAALGCFDKFGAGTSSDGLKDPLRAALAFRLRGEMDMIHIDLGRGLVPRSVEMAYQDKAGAVEVTDFFGRDETLAHLSFACAEILCVRTAGNAKRVVAFAHLLAIYMPTNTLTSPHTQARAKPSIKRLSAFPRRRSISSTKPSSTS